MASDLVVYTAVLGGYEHLLDQDVARGSDARFVCFTDDPALTSETWDVRLVEPAFPLEPTLSARRLKVLGHRDLGTDLSLWIDNSVRLTEDPVGLVAGWLGQGAELAVPMHSFRTTVLREAEAVIAAGRAGAEAVERQMRAYLRVCPEVLGHNPHWTAILARRRTARLDRAMETWWEHICHYTHRDQLSFNVATADLDVRTLPVDNGRSEFHRWPAAVRPGGFRAEDGAAGQSSALLAGVAAEEERRHELFVKTLVSVEAREARIAELETCLVAAARRLEAAPSTR